MLYIKIGENKYPIDAVEVFTTQRGNTGIRIVGDAPLAEDGFEIVDDDKVIGDESSYKYLYREDDKCKEYTQVTEEIIPAESHFTGDIPVNPIQRQISSLNRRVNAITPYTMSKDVYIGNTECVFEKVKDGNISAWLTVGNEQIPCSYEVVNDAIIVTFEALEEVGTANISIQ